MGRICDICNTDLGEQTDYNFNRHRNSNQCQANQNRKKLIKDSSQSIKTYFFKTSSLQPSGLGTTNLNEIHSKEATRSNPIDLIDDTVLVDSNDLMNNELNNHINPHKRKTYDDSVFDLSKIDQSKCGGYAIEKFDDMKFYSNFPFQIFSESNMRLNFVLESNKLHSISCSKNNYLCPLGESSNKECANLKHDSTLQGIIERMSNVKKHTNYQYMNFSQLVDTINHYVKLVNKSKLENLNNNRTILALRNKITLFKRFVLLISMNDIPRLSFLIKICLSRNCSINVIIEKMKAAIDGTYAPKQWDESDKDLGILVMNIGGPALLSAFKGRLPSTSYMYKV
jgi:hypothetical protein